jgi:hypothetical protein
MLTENPYSRQGHPPYFSNFVVLTMGSTSGEGPTRIPSLIMMKIWTPEDLENHQERDSLIMKNIHTY